jgi:hypothetical protein
LHWAVGRFAACAGRSVLRSGHCAYFESRARADRGAEWLVQQRRPCLLDVPGDLLQGVIRSLRPTELVAVERVCQSLIRVVRAPLRGLASQSQRQDGLGQGLVENQRRDG